MLLLLLGLLVGQAPPAPSYAIGPSDVLSVMFWQDKSLSVDTVTVRPDGMISLPLLNDVYVVGLTPDQLRTRLAQLATRFIEEPDVYVVVKEIHSRTVFITGSVAKPSGYPLNNGLTVLQLIALAGGLQEYADAKHITVTSADGTKQIFNYKTQSPVIHLTPGDTVVVN